MIQRSKISIYLIFLIVSLGGCKTYYIPVESFESQLLSIDSTQLKLVKTRGPAGDIVEYLANPIDKIKCIDKDGKEFFLKNSPSIETRISTVDGKKTVFYFDRIYLKNDTLVGYRSRFIEFPKEILLTEVTQIEVQNGGKNFKYIK